MFMNAPSPAPRVDAAPAIQSSVKDGIALVVLNRPKASNSLSEAMLQALSATFAEIATNKRVRAVVLAAYFI
jgi:enoyl-CoA hydratase/carnithine racemase